MTIQIQFDCPFCKTSKAGFKIVRDIKSPRSDFVWNSMGVCGVCNEIVMFIFETSNDRTGPSESGMFQFNFSEQDIVETFPKKAGPRLTEAIPENVLKPYIEAEKSFESGLFSAAASCYRKAMERAVKHINPEANGMLNARIRGLEKLQILPQSMIELLDHVRLFGNVSMHEDDEDPNQQDCESAREFTYLFLRYAFSLPSMVAEAKAKQEK
mgnify:CR=1 FL=1